MNKLVTEVFVIMQKWRNLLGAKDDKHVQLMKCNYYKGRQEVKNVFIIEWKKINQLKISICVKVKPVYI